MLNMGIQIINIGIDMLNFGMQMPNLYFQIQNIDMQIQNLGLKINMKNNMMPNMNINMNMQSPNIGFQNQNMMMNNINDRWNLRFEDKTGEIINIIISPTKTLEEAINLYKIKSNNKSHSLKFIFNGKKLFPDLKISQSGLSDNSKIIVLDVQPVLGG